MLLFVFAISAPIAQASTSFLNSQNVNRFTDSIDGAEVAQTSGSTASSVDWIGMLYGTPGDVNVCDTLAANSNQAPGTSLWCGQKDIPNLYFNNCVYTCQSGNGSGTNIQTPGSLTTFLYTTAPSVQTFALGARGNGHDCGNDSEASYCMLWSAQPYTPEPPSSCADITAEIGNWYNGGTQTTLWLETGENASNGGGLNNNNFWLNQCKADCEIGGHDRCNFRFNNDLGETQASQTSYRCSAVTGAAVLEAKNITIVGDLETQYTAITVPSSCTETTSSCVCDATFQWNGASAWSLWSQDSSTPGCVVVTPSSSMTPPPDPSAGIVDLVIYEGGQIRWASTDPMVPEYTPHDTYDMGSCPLTAGPNLTAGSVTPTTATVGSAVTLSATVTNSGTVNTGVGFTNLFQIDADADHSTLTTTKTDTSPILNISGTDVTSKAHTFATAGTWYVRVCADNNASMVGAITETNEGDNCGAWTPITVTSGGGSCNFTNTNIVFNWGTGSNSSKPGSEVYSAYGDYGLDSGTSRNWTATVNVTNNGVTKSFNAVCPGFNSINAPCTVNTGSQDVGGDSISLFFEVQSYIHARIDCSANPVTSCSASPASTTAGGSTTWTALPSGLASYTFTPSETGTGVVRATNTYARTYSTAGSYGMSVTAGGATVACSNTVTVGNPSCGTASPTITAVPDRVTTGGTSVITVSATGVDGTCTVTGPGVNQTLTATSCGIPSTNITTGALTGQSTYTVSCDSGETTAKTVINVSTKWTIF